MWPPQKRAVEPHRKDTASSAMSSWPSNMEQAVKEALPGTAAGGGSPVLPPWEGVTSGALDEISGERLSAADMQRAIRGARALLRDADGKTRCL